MIMHFMQDMESCLKSVDEMMMSAEEGKWESQNVAWLFSTWWGKQLSKRVHSLVQTV